MFATTFKLCVYSFVLLFVACNHSIAAPQVLWRGRVNTHGDTVSFDWPGVEGQVSFQGKSISCLMRNTGENLFNIFVDGNLIQVLQTYNNVSEYLLASGLSPNIIHTLLITKRTEPLVGMTEMLQFKIDEIYYSVLPAPETLSRQSKKIEFIGDSITCGYGDEGTYPCHFTPQTENNFKAYGKVTADLLGIDDVHIESWSGKGVVRNYGYPNVTSPDPLPAYFPLTLATNFSSMWNFENWNPDIVVINLGTNDYSTQPYPPQSIFENGYLTFISFIQTQYQAHSFELFLVCGPMIGDPCCQYVQNVCQQVDNCHFIDMQNLLVFPNDYGCDGHPNTSGHQKMAQVAASAIKNFL